MSINIPVYNNENNLICKVNTKILLSLSSQVYYSNHPLPEVHT